MWNLIKQKTGNRTVVTRVREVGEMGDVGQRIHSCSYNGWISFRDLMYNMMTIAFNIVLYSVTA